MNAALVHPQSDHGIRPAERLPATVHVGRVRLAVSDLRRSSDFYTQVIGLQLQESTSSTARLGAQDDDRTLLELEQLPGVQPIAGRSPLGLYHTAFLLPDRESLSSFVQHLQARKIRFGAADHVFSEALYLTDPD